MQLIFKKSSILKKIVDAIKDVCKETNIELSENGLHIKAMDCSHVCLVNLKISSLIENIISEKPVIIAINLEQLSKVLRLFDNEAELFLFHADNKLTLTSTYEGQKAKFDSEVLVEQFLDGKEVSVGVMNYENEIKVFGITEIATTNDFFDYEAKYEGKHEEISPARINEIQKENVEKAAKEIYVKLNMKGFSRSDFIFMGDTPFLLEVNSIPGMTEQSIFPKQVKMNNISLRKLFTYMIEDTLKIFKK